MYNPDQQQVATLKSFHFSDGHFYQVYISKSRFAMAAISISLSTERQKSIILWLFTTWTHTHLVQSSKRNLLKVHISQCTGTDDVMCKRKLNVFESELYQSSICLGEKEKKSEKKRNAKHKSVHPQFVCSQSKWIIFSI